MRTDTRWERMISKLPYWAWLGAWALACVAGMVNVVGLLGLEHQAITHLTGTTSMLAAAVAEKDGAAVVQLCGVLGAFLTGCVLSGFIIQDSTLKIGRRYGVALLVESLLFIAAVPLLKGNNAAGLYLAASACGLQNAMVTTYSGTVIRTCHLSGMFTDLGIFLGHAIRGLRVDAPRLRMSLLIISAFFCGGVIGTRAYRRLGYATLYLPAAITGAMALTYGCHRLLHRERSATR